MSKYLIDNVSIENKIDIISNILDLFDQKIYKFFPTKRLERTKRRLSKTLFNLYLYDGKYESESKSDEDDHLRWVSL